MNREQRRVIALAAYGVAFVLFVFFFGTEFWQWATWDKSRGTLDFGIIKLTSRPPFPNDARSVLVGLVLPIALAAFGRVFEREPGRKD